MKRFSAAIILLLFFLVYLYTVPSFAEDRKDLKHYPPPEEYRKSSQNSHANRPILPPTVPSPSSGVSPTPSPHISSPPINPGIISAPPYTNPGFSPPVHIPSPPSTPAYIATPVMPVNMVIPQVPIIGNTIGEVLNKGSEKNGILWIQVKDQLFNEVVRIKIRNLKNTPITRQAAIMRFEDIKIGDTVNIIFTNEGENNIANFISVLTEEELEMMKGAGPGQVTISNELDNQDDSAGHEQGINEPAE